MNTPTDPSLVDLPPIVEAMLPQATEPAHEVPFPTDWPVGLASPEPDRYVVLQEENGRFYPIVGVLLDTRSQALERAEDKYFVQGTTQVFIARVATPELVPRPEAQTNTTH